ncbi:hypothetical protein J6590_024206 [Homalodisca vitripennis]|nr:hypothetical protein J6590_024206 [Homalodisca vitripennis]
MELYSIGGNISDNKSMRNCVRRLPKLKLSTTRQGQTVLGFPQSPEIMFTSAIEQILLSTACSGYFTPAIVRMKFSLCEVSISHVHIAKYLNVIYIKNSLSYRTRCRLGTAAGENNKREGQSRGWELLNSTFPQEHDDIQTGNNLRIQVVSVT